MSDLRLVMFDVDGTLVDSQADIIASMHAAFGAADLAPPERSEILSIVGLSLPKVMEALARDAGAATHALMVEAYKDAYTEQRQSMGAAASSPLYPGALEALNALNGQDDTLIGVATGKSRRGLDHLLEAHDLARFFVTQQVADHHPSKPHPSMLLTAMVETGIDPENCIMIGDTRFDLEMAKSAGVAFVGVPWGYHPAEQLTGAHAIIERFDDLPSVLDSIWGRGA